MVRRGSGVQIPSSASASARPGHSQRHMLAELLSMIVVVILAMAARRLQYGQSVSLDQFGHFVLYAVLAVCISLPGIKFFLSWLLPGSPNPED